MKNEAKSWWIFKKMNDEYMSISLTIYSHLCLIIFITKVRKSSNQVETS